MNASIPNVISGGFFGLFNCPTISQGRCRYHCSDVTRAASRFPERHTERSSTR